jgi:hypothetical protein
MAGWGSERFGADSFGGNVTETPTGNVLAIKLFLYMDQTEGNAVEQAADDELELNQIIANTGGFCSTYIAGENLVTGNVVYESDSGIISKADNTNLGKSRILGVVFANTDSGQAAFVVQKGPLTIPSASFIVNTPLFLGTNGNITSILPFASNARVIRVGYAQSSTSICVRLQDLGRRAS